MASRDATAASSIALTSENAPVYRAIGVRAPATITTSVGNMTFVLPVQHDLLRPCKLCRVYTDRCSRRPATELNLEASLRRPNPVLRLRREEFFAFGMSGIGQCSSLTHSHLRLRRVLHHHGVSALFARFVHGK